MKPRVGFLFTGQGRCNPLSFNNYPNYAILEGYTNNIFTNEFKEKFDYDIFISTDDIHLQKTFDYFGADHVKNIHILEPHLGGEQIYLKDVSYKLQWEKYYLDNYLNQNFMGCEPYAINNILQNYKVRDAFHLLEQSGYNYDFIIRVRLDVIFVKNIMDCFNQFFANPDLHIIGHNDFFFIGKPSIMKFYCLSIDRNYGKYNFNLTNHVFKKNIVDYEYYNSLKKGDYKRWTYAPEIQTWETLFEFCSIHNLDIDKTINGMYVVDYICH